MCVCGGVMARGQTWPKGCACARGQNQPRVGEACRVMGAHLQRRACSLGSAPCPPCACLWGLTSTAREGGLYGQCASANGPRRPRTHGQASTDPPARAVKLASATCALELALDHRSPPGQHGDASGHLTRRKTADWVAGVPVVRRHTVMVHTAQTAREPLFVGLARSSGISLQQHLACR